MTLHEACLVTNIFMASILFFYSKEIRPLLLYIQLGGNMW